MRAILEIEPVRLCRWKALIIQKPHDSWALRKVQALHDVHFGRDVGIPLARLTLAHVFFDDHLLYASLAESGKGLERNEDHYLLHISFVVVPLPETSTTEATLPERSLTHPGRPVFAAGRGSYEGRSFVAPKLGIIGAGISHNILRLGGIVGRLSKLFFITGVKREVNRVKGSVRR